MVNNDFINKLFKRREEADPKDDEREHEIIDLIDNHKDFIEKEKEEVETVITKFNDKLHLARQIIEGEDQVHPVMPLYYDKAGLWWKWNQLDKRWEIIDEVDLLNFISFASPANTVNSKERGEIIQALKQVARKNKPEEPGRDVLQFGDELINLTTGERGKASPNYFLTNPIPWKIGRSEETPTIDKIFSQWVGEEYVLTLKQILAYSMIPDMPLHRIFCFIGEGMNGKSKYLELLRKFIGKKNCCATELDTLLNSRFEVTRLHKKLVCQMGETNFNEMSKTSLLKKLSGGDLIGFEYKNKNPFEEKNYAKIIIATNNLPMTTDKTIGFYRRWLIIDFPNSFSEKKDILSEIPDVEYENLANQSIRLLMDLMRDREFHNEGTIEERMEKYESKSNFLKKFTELFTKEDLDGFITKADFARKFNDWCKENRHRQLSDRSISLFMRKEGIETGKKTLDFMREGKLVRAMAWIGIKWKDE